MLAKIIFGSFLLLTQVALANEASTEFQGGGSSAVIIDGKIHLQELDENAKNIKPKTITPLIESIQPVIEPIQSVKEFYKIYYKENVDNFSDAVKIYVQKALDKTVEDLNKQCASINLDQESTPLEEASQKVNCKLFNTYKENASKCLKVKSADGFTQIEYEYYSTPDECGVVRQFFEQSLIVKMISTELKKIEFSKMKLPNPSSMESDGKK